VLLYSFIAHCSAKKVDLDDKMIDRLADDAMDDRGTLPNNPCRPIKEDLVELYHRVLPQYQREKVKF
jgi:alcohol dehydrogenase class IV